MKYLDEYRDPVIARALLDRIARTVTQPWTLMEICGGQTHTLIRHGIDELLPREISIVHGPGCPVCVTAVELIDQAIYLALQRGVTLVSFGDMLRVPGSSTDLLRARAEGADVRIAYSPLDALKIARANPLREVVFFAVGFETTAPANAMAVWQAREEGLRNFSLLSAHVLVPPAVSMLLSSPANRVQGLIAPGHVCAIAGLASYKELSARYHTPVVVAGFEPADLLEAILKLVIQLEEGRAEVENPYARSVPEQGNPHARTIVEKVFAPCDRSWRGIGMIPASGLALREEFAAWDAARRFDSPAQAAPPPGVCIAASILQGLRKPLDCPAFDRACTPETPLGAPMVSSEGACAAYHQYRRTQR